MTLLEFEQLASTVSSPLIAASRVSHANGSPGQRVLRGAAGQAQRFVRAGTGCRPLSGGHLGEPGPARRVDDEDGRAGVPGQREQLAVFGQGHVVVAEEQGGDAEVGQHVGVEERLTLGEGGTQRGGSHGDVGAVDVAQPEQQICQAA